MNLATLTTLIDDNIRNKTPKVIKVEHADVEQAIVDELFSEIETITGTTTTGLPYTIKASKKGNLVCLNVQTLNNTNLNQSGGVIYFPEKYQPFMREFRTIEFETGTSTRVYLLEAGPFLFLTFPFGGFACEVLPPNISTNQTFTYISNDL